MRWTIAQIQIEEKQIQWHTVTRKSGAFLNYCGLTYLDPARSFRVFHHPDCDPILRAQHTKLVRFDQVCMNQNIAKNYGVLFRKPSSR